MWRSDLFKENCVLKSLTLILTLLFTTAVFAADPPKPKPGLSDAQKVRMQAIEIEALQLELNRMRAAAPYEMQQKILQVQLNAATEEAIKAFKLDSSKWRLDLNTFEFVEQPTAATAPAVKK